MDEIVAFAALGFLSGVAAAGACVTLATGALWIVVLVRDAMEKNKTRPARAKNGAGR